MGFGPGGLRLGRVLERVARREGISVALAPPIPLAERFASRLGIPILAQRADAAAPGASTGAIVPEALEVAGLRGSLVNHAEARVPARVTEEVVERLRSRGLTAVVCAGDVSEARRLAARSRPPYLAIEPPELIGGTVSVSRARPGVIQEAVRAVRRVSPRTRVLCGAGIQDERDVRRALELGSDGVLVASSVALAADPAGVARTLLRGFRRPPGRGGRAIP